jgi:enamine deaminase RidA (YjgF/YER057c/UK114 family)
VDTNILFQALPQPAPPGSTQPVTAHARIHRQRSAGLELIQIESAPVSELHLTVTPGEGESPTALVKRLAKALSPWDATIVRQIVLGSIKAHRVTLEALRQTFDDPSPPLTWVEGAGCNNNPIAGMQVHAVVGAEVRTVENRDGSPARVWDDAVATHCVLSACGPTRTTASPPEQATETLENLQAGLAQAGMTMKDVARTWFFLDDILSWYDDFNRARNTFFARSELRAGSLPASTGVSGRNPAGSALSVATWAIGPHDDAARAVQIVPSPRQCPAPAYGSAFSRAIEISSAGFRQLLVSGTASIAPDGRTGCIGDVRGQIELTMQVVGAILESRHMTFADVSRATAYFKSPADVAVWEDWLARHEQESLPVVCACCDICRGNLLFEIELDAIRTGS